MALQRKTTTAKVEENVSEMTDDKVAEMEAMEAEAELGIQDEEVMDVPDAKTTPKQMEKKIRKITETKEVATKQAAGSPALAGGKFILALEELKQDEEGTTFDFGILPRVKAEQGMLTDNDGESLGTYIDIELMAFNSRYVISPNDKKAPIECVRYSLNGTTLDDGSGVTVKEWLEEIKEDWPKADVREYFEVNGVLLNSDKPSTFVDDLIQIQCSPTTRKSFEAHRTQLTMKLRMGKINTDEARRMRFTATPKKTNDGSSYTMMKVGSTPA